MRRKYEMMIRGERHSKNSYLDGPIRLIRQLHRHALFEFHVHEDTLRGCRLGTHRHLEHALLVGGRGILEHPALVAGVEKVLIDGVIALGLGIHWNAMLGAVRQQIRSPLERFDEFRISPRGDGPDLGVQGLGAHYFESHLIVPLPGGAVGHVGIAPSRTSRAGTVPRRWHCI